MADPLQPKSLRGQLDAAGLRFGIVVSRFNNFITDRLLAAALEALARGGATGDQIETVHVPGSFEIPVAAKKLAAAHRPDAIVCIGCVLRGETSHYDYVCTETSRGIQLAQMDTGVPMIFCLLTCDTLEQAIDRAGLKGGNKGYEAGLAAIEMASLSRQLAPRSELRGSGAARGAASGGKAGAKTKPSRRRR
jgi:6,7-dimethyl-8-ribityllumazine synthase